MRAVLVFAFVKLTVLKIQTAILYKENQVTTFTRVVSTRILWWWSLCYGQTVRVSFLQRKASGS